MNDFERENLQLLMNAMTSTQSTSGSQYTLPQDVMLRYAELVRADERKKCSERIEDYCEGFDRDYRELGGELAAELVKDDPV